MKLSSRVASLEEYVLLGAPKNMAQAQKNQLISARCSTKQSCRLLPKKCLLRKKPSAKHKRTPAQLSLRKSQAENRCQPRYVGPYRHRQVSGWSTATPSGSGAQSQWC